MNDHDRITIARLRREGHAVVIFTPEELRGANPDLVQDRLIERGWDVIDSLCTEDEEGEQP